MPRLIQSVAKESMMGSGAEMFSKSSVFVRVRESDSALVAGRTPEGLNPTEETRRRVLFACLADPPRE
jgi:hypothetical protein